jgi:hypothetical protein
MLARLDQLCAQCDYYYRFESGVARMRGDTAAADALLARLPSRAPRP